MTDVPSGRGRSIFISYDHTDTEFAERLAKSLRDAGAKVWIDEAGIRVGDDYVETITAAIEEHEEFLLIMTPAANKSRFVKLELRRAFRKMRALLPVMRIECEVPFLVDDRHYIDFTAFPYEEGVAQVLRGKGEVPPWYRRLLAYLTLSRVAAIFAIVAVSLYAGYRLMPSRTFATVLDDHNDEAVTLQFQNRGGRPSTIKGGFRLKFGDLPIVDTTLDVDQTPPPVPGHGIVPVTLNTKSGFEPKKLPGDCYLNEKQIRRRLPGHEITLEVDVQESSGPVHTVPIIFAADRIGPFLIKHLPTDVPTGGNCAP
ncbi:MAG TPA: toll/interleukin-1 receptor domain-containing protein [Thermoanaerobaculia bacterium]|nr:toll/interleukin-1 receptor domain-containing protein [Thermoanaerobaculia bacterium]